MDAPPLPFFGYRSTLFGIHRNTEYGIVHPIHQALIGTTSRPHFCNSSGPNQENGLIDPGCNRQMLALQGFYLQPRRVDVKGILRDPVTRRDLMTRSVMALQARAGTTTTRDQAAAAVDNVKRRGTMTLEQR